MSENIVTGLQIAQTALEAYECHGGYIWGQMGATWTAAKQANLEKRYNADPEKMANYKGSATYGSQWVGHRVWDCAGLPRWAAKQYGLAIHSGSNLIWDCDLAKKGKLTAGMELPVGALVFTGTDAKKPHVGVYTGNGIVTEATGAKKGVIQSKLTDSKWKYWGLLKKVSYEFVPGTDKPAEPAKPQEAAKPAEPASLPTLRRGNKNKYVTQLQKDLAALGYSLGICGIDGDYGTATESAVKAFQKDHQLVQDGVTGPKTWAAIQAAVEKQETKPAEKPAEKKYRITVTGLTEAQAEEIQKKYGGTVTAE